MKLKIFFIFAIFFLLFSSCQEYFGKTNEVKEPGKLNKLGDSLFFSIDDNSDNPIYIQGSYHEGEPELYPMDPLVEEKLKSSDEVFFEVKEILDPEKTSQIYIKTSLKYYKKSKFKDGNSIKSILSQDEWDKMLQIFGKHKVTEEFYLSQANDYYPWVTTSTMETLPPLPVEGEKEEEQVPPKLSRDYAVDIYLANMAVENKKRVSGMEKIEDQFIQSYIDFPLDLQIANLKYFIKSLSSPETVSKDDAKIDELYQAYKNKNATEFEKVFLSSLELPKDLLQSIDDQKIIEYTKMYVYNLFAKRNMNWASKIENKLLKSKSKRYFIVVGAGHLVGENSLIDILLKNGHNITQY